MRRYIQSVVCVGLLLLATGASGEVFNPNPFVKISILGPESFSIAAPGQALADRFAVRLVDPLGEPIQGLTVEFFPDVQFCFSGDPHCSVPAAGVYGHFPGSGEKIVLTDADGMAVADDFVGGTAAGTYKVAAFVSELSSTRNNQVLVSGGDLIAEFTITQFANTASVPATTSWVLWMLAFVLACLGILRIAPARPRFAD